MPIHVPAIAILLALLVIAIALTGHAVGSEFYVLIPGRYRGLNEPPTSPWIIVLLVGLAAGMFFFSKRYAAVILAALPLLVLLGLPAGIFLFDWTPGITQYLLVLGLGGLATYVWSHDCLNED
jgi:uncharacterized membrane protein